MRFIGVVAASLLLAGCLGDEDPDSTRIAGRTLTIYSSLPLHGHSAEAARAVAAGQRRALADAGGRVGRYRLELVQLDSSGPDDSTWDPDRVSENAHRAVEDETAIAYIGELDFGGSAVSVPITNDEGLLQVSPLDGLTSLTRRPPGSPRAGPERYYPSERRSFLRLVPSDLELARALVELVARDGAERVGLVHDDGIYSGELTRQVGSLARAGGLQVETVEGPEEADDAAKVALELTAQRVDAVVYAGAARPAVVPLLSALSRELPRVPVYGGPGLAGTGAPASAPDEVAVIRAVGPPPSYPARSRAVIRDLDQGSGPVPAEALYGYESVRLVLDAIEQAGPDRRRVVRSALEPRRRDSLLGVHRVLPRGEAGGRALSLYRLDAARFEFDRFVE